VESAGSAYTVYAIDGPTSPAWQCDPYLMDVMGGGGARVEELKHKSKRGGSEVKICWVQTVAGSGPQHAQL
jgi:hypothetical protein